MKGGQQPVVLDEHKTTNMRKEQVSLYPKEKN